jgi:hypothetical protein
VADGAVRGAARQVAPARDDVGVRGHRELGLRDVVVHPFPREEYPADERSPRHDQSDSQHHDVLLQRLHCIAPTVAGPLGDGSVCAPERDSPLSPIVTRSRQALRVRAGTRRRASSMFFTALPQNDIDRGASMTIHARHASRVMSGTCGTSLARTLSTPRRVNSISAVADPPTTATGGALRRGGKE